MKNDEIAEALWVECSVCKQHLKNWTGSTPCCGAIGYVVENGETTSKVSLFASFGDSEIKPTVIDLGTNSKP